MDYRRSKLKNRSNGDGGPAKGQQWMEAPEAPHLLHPAQEPPEAAAKAEAEFPATGERWTEHLPAPRPQLRRRAVTQHSRDLVSARYRSRFLQHRVVPFLRRHVRGLRKPMHLLAPISERSHSPLAHDHTGPSPSAHFPGNGSDTSGPRGLERDEFKPNRGGIHESALFGFTVLAGKEVSMDGKALLGVTRSPRDDMEMRMHNSLTRGRPIIRAEIKSGNRGVGGG